MSALLSALLSSASLHSRSSMRLMRLFSDSTSSVVTLTNKTATSSPSFADHVADNAFRSVSDWLVADASATASQFDPRQIHKAHYVDVSPEPCSSPVLVAVSSSCADMLGLPPGSGADPVFAEVMSGNKVIPGLDIPFVMNYGCHSFGQWFGQLGDGRAMSLGELTNPQTRETYELQLKGCGRSPFSRGFDGKAVLRSSVREFLASEAMHHLGVSTTRALSLVGTGDEVMRAWYDVTSSGGAANSATTKFPPNVMKIEKGAVVCRVARSFLRLGHMELFAIRGEHKELIQLADYVCVREFPQLMRLSVPARYIELYREVVAANAKLVVDWLRVGYVQGNMNSDNTCLAGRTIDYGPYGWMEAFSPKYQPFTTDRAGNFCFIMQPSAMQVNLQVLADKTFSLLVRQSMLAQKGFTEEDIAKSVGEISSIAQDGYASAFWKAYEGMKRRKLGLKAAYSETSKDDAAWWIELEKLLYRSKADFTIFFRELSSAADQSTSSMALDALRISFYESLDEDTESAWSKWLDVYLSKISTEAQLWTSPLERKTSQNSSNPKYVLRNWMAVLAYESAEKGDFSVVSEILDLLTDPYALRDVSGDADAARARAERWYRKTPSWATNMPGCTFMSCSS